MAILSIEYASDCLRRTVDVKAVVPWEMAGGGAKRRLLILLHGYGNRNTEWIRNSSIVSLASKYNLCVVMPSGENSFYLDGKETGRQYGTFVGSELPEFICGLFGMNCGREDTFIGGLSMGGFGAIHVSLRFPRRFGRLFAFSSALLQYELDRVPPEGNSVANREYYELMFGDLKKVMDSRSNPEVLIREAMEKGEQLPEIYMACGTEDFLLEPNRRFAAFLREHGVKHEYHEGPGGHDFAFWNQYLERAVRWLAESGRDA